MMGIGGVSIGELDGILYVHVASMPVYAAIYYIIYHAQCKNQESEKKKMVYIKRYM
jgi:hypothetical protein